MKAAKVPAKGSTSPRMNSENYERAREMEASDSSMMSSAMSVIDATSVNCEICVNCGNDVVQA
jgi:hypothetical protein